MDLSVYGAESNPAAWPSLLRKESEANLKLLKAVKLKGETADPHEIDRIAVKSGITPVPLPGNSRNL